MKVYHYQEKTLEFVGEEIARPDPRSEGHFLIPSGTTPLAPPDVDEGEIACFIEGAWEVKQDHRGEHVTEKETGELVIIDYLGDIKPEQTTQPRPDVFYVFDDNGWIINDTLKQAFDSDVAKVALQALDLKSIRYMREWIAGQSDASEQLKQYELDVLVERDKVIS